MQLTSAEIRQRNKELTEQTRAIAAEIGLLWYQISKRELWKDWGYNTFGDCLQEEGPRSYTTIMECIVNYEFVCIHRRHTFDEFRQFVVDLGMRKVSKMRQMSRLQHTELVDTTDEETAGIPELPPYPAPLPLKEIAQNMAHLTVKQARKAVQDEANKRGIAVQFSIYVSLHFADEDMYEMFKLAIRHIKERAGQSLSDEQALTLLCGEYLAEKGMRVVDQEAA